MWLYSHSLKAETDRKSLTAIYKELRNATEGTAFTSEGKKSMTQLQHASQNVT